MADVHSDMVAWIDKQSRNQTVVNFLSKVILNNRLLAAHLAISTPRAPVDTEVVQIKKLVKRIRRKGLTIKYINLLLFWLAVSLLVAGTVWPLIEFLWLRREGDIVTGVIQSALLVFGGIALGWYRYWKLTQTKIEDTLRLTLFAHETVEQKIHRLENTLWSTPKLKGCRETTQANNPPLVQWWFASEDEVREKVAHLIVGDINSEELISIATQLKDAGIKNYAINVLLLSMTTLAIFFITVGLLLPLLIPLFNFQPLLPNPGAFQSLFVVGFGGLFLTLRGQYVRKRDRLHDAANNVFSNRESFEFKQRRLMEVLREIDTGPNPGEVTITL